MHKLLFAV